MEGAPIENGPARDGPADQRKIEPGRLSCAQSQAAGRLEAARQERHEVVREGAGDEMIERLCLARDRHREAAHVEDQPAQDAPGSADVVGLRDEPVHPPQLTGKEPDQHPVDARVRASQPVDSTSSVRYARSGIGSARAR